MESTQQTGLDWLYCSQLFGIRLGLENMRRLLDALDLPAAGQKFIHVAGTNGKGSTCAFIHSIFNEAGINAGLFTSPHLVRFNERIRDAERMISDEEIETGLARLRDVVADWDPQPTFFELALALALDWFRQRKLEWVILETGLGGRLDATNVITPAVSVITRIGMDHMQQLGDTLAAIAAEKAGIIKPGVPVVTCPQQKEALAVIRAAAGREGSDLTVVAEPVMEVPLALAGPHQAWNAALAVAALQEAGIRLPAVVMERGLARVDWPARFQRLDGGSIVVDGAHNDDAAQALAVTWREEFPGEKAAIIFGGSTGKDLAATLTALAPIARRMVFTGFASPRAVAAAELLRVWEDVDNSFGVPATTSASLREALALVQPGERVLVTGSLFLAGEFLADRDQLAQAYQASTQ